MKAPIVIYDLKDDRRLLDAVQEATLTTSKYGIVPEHGLFGSDEWWQSIELGQLPAQAIEGHITDLGFYPVSTDGLEKASTLRS